MGRRSSRKPAIFVKLSKFAKKGVSGKVITIVISLIIAIGALILLWTFLVKTAPLISGGIENIVKELKRQVCESTWVFSGICKLLGI